MLHSHRVNNLGTRDLNTEYEAHRNPLLTSFLSRSLPCVQIPAPPLNVLVTSLWVKFRVISILIAYDNYMFYYIYVKHLDQCLPKSNPRELSAALVAVSNFQGGLDPTVERCGRKLAFLTCWTHGSILISVLSGFTWNGIYALRSPEEGLGETWEMPVVLQSHHFRGIFSWHCLITILFAIKDLLRSHS